MQTTITAFKISLLSLLVGFLLVIPSIGLVFPTILVSSSNNSTLNRGSFSCPVISGAGSSACSSNWAGYVDSGSGVTAVSGAWTVPTLTCSTTGSKYVAVWVGIDGYSSNTVEQTGIMGRCSKGIAVYSAWYEFYPAPSMTISSIKVSPGDAFSASVTYSGTTFTATITDTTTGATYSTYSTAAASRSSAEWVVERPELCNILTCKLSSLANFGSVTFTSASATIGGTTGSINAAPFSDVAFTMIGSITGPILAKPSSLSSDGTSFSIAYK